ncbi:MAG TPA: hypothetical protein VGI81_18295 [Tepidisphaeraceae bacterium]|jgi:hypothetical protein
MALAVAPTPNDPAGRSDAARVLVRLIAGVFGAIVLACGATAGLIVVAHRPEWWSGWVAATAISVIAALLAMAPLAPALWASVQYAAYGYLGGAVLRMIASVLGGLAAVMIFRTPPMPTLLMLAPPYLAQVAAEALVLGRFFWPRG